MKPNCKKSSTVQISGSLQQVLAYHMSCDMKTPNADAADECNQIKIRK